MDSEKRQELEESLAFLRSRFDELNQDIKRPHSLDAEVLRKKLEELEESTPSAHPPLRFPRRWKAAAGIAACFVFVAGALFLAGPQSTGNSLLSGGTAETTGAGEVLSSAAVGAPAPEAAMAEEGVLMKENPESGELQDAAIPRMAAYSGAPGAAYAESYAQIRDRVYMLGTEPETGLSTSLRLGEDQAVEEAVQDSVDLASAGVSEDHKRYETGELIRTDGIYLYSYVMKNSTSTGPFIQISTVNEMEEVASIPLESAIQTFYVYGDQIVTLSLDYHGIPLDVLPMETIAEAAPLEESAVQQGNWCGVDSDTGTKATFYDISDPAQPQLVKTFQQDGQYLSSQLEGNTLYVLSRWGVSQDPTASGATLKELVPVTYDSSQETAKLLEAEQIVNTSDASSPLYAVVSVIDLSNLQIQTQAVLGGADGFYLTSENLYLYGNAEGGRTNLIRMELVPGGCSLAASGSVSGQLADGASLKEQDGILRVATTLEVEEGSCENSLYLLDQWLQPVGSLEGILKQGALSAACYLNGAACLSSTTQDESLLLSVDLSDPIQPKTGETLTLPLFLRQLHPLGEGFVLGIGQSVESQGNSGGLELVLLDLSDPAAPSLVSSYSFGEGSYSDVLNAPNRLLVLQEEQLVGLPILTRSSATEKERAYIVFSWGGETGLTQQGLLTQTQLSNTDYSAPEQAAAVDGMLYVFSADWLTKCQIEAWSVLGTAQLF